MIDFLSNLSCVMRAHFSWPSRRARALRAYRVASVAGGTAMVRLSPRVVAARPARFDLSRVFDFSGAPLRHFLSCSHHECA